MTSATVEIDYNPTDSPYLVVNHPSTNWELGDGWLLLTLADITRLDTLPARYIVNEWAEQNNFSLEGIDPSRALEIIFALICCAADETFGWGPLLGDNWGSFIAGATVENMPAFTVILNPTIVKASLVTAFDGVDDADVDAIDAAVARRAL